jgi:hypothetical protein
MPSQINSQITLSIMAITMNNRNKPSEAQKGKKITTTLMQMVV